MKKLLVATAIIAFTATFNANAAAEGKRKLTDEQKALRKELIAKYDTNKDGKLDKSEKAKMSKEDKERSSKAGLGKKNRHAKQENTESSPSK